MAINTEYVLRRNRHNIHTGEWYGPDPEPNKPGPKCICLACDLNYPYKKEKALKSREYVGEASVKGDKNGDD